MPDPTQAERRDIWSTRDLFGSPRTVSALSSEIRVSERSHDLADGLRSGAVRAGDVEPIRLVQRDGKLFTLDNRRLAAFHLAGVNAPYRMATAAEIAKEWNNKFTTTTDGLAITVRGGGGTVP